MEYGEYYRTFECPHFGKNSHVLELLQTDRTDCDYTQFERLRHLEIKSEKSLDEMNQRLLRCPSPQISLVNFQLPRVNFATVCRMLHSNNTFFQKLHHGHINIWCNHLTLKEYLLDDQPVLKSAMYQVKTDISEDRAGSGHGQSIPSIRKGMYRA